MHVGAIDANTGHSQLWKALFREDGTGSVDAWNSELLLGVTDMLLPNGQLVPVEVTDYEVSSSGYHEAVYQSVTFTHPLRGAQCD